MYKFVNNNIHLTPSCINNGVREVRAIDCNDGDFVMNEHGHIRSDFAVLTDTNDSVELAKALTAMQTAYQNNSSQFDGMTFEQMVTAIRPRWCQLPGEVDRFEQYLIDNALEFYNKLRAENESVDDDGVLPEKPAKIAPVSDTLSES